MWQALYDSRWQHPGVAWLGALLLLSWLAAKLGFLRGYLLLFGVASAVDALCTSGVLPLHESLATTLAVAFVLLGDLRLFLVTERACEPGGALSAGAVGRALALTFVVPLISTALRLLSPAIAQQPRLQFFVYEALFFCMALGYRALCSYRLAHTRERHRWAAHLCSFVLVQYLLWALADALLLLGVKVGLGLRLLPNLMYYALFLPAVYVTAPSREQRKA